MLKTSTILSAACSICLLGASPEALLAEVNTLESALVAAESNGTTGVLKSVDEEKTSFIIVSDGKELTFKFDNHTSFMLNGKAAKREDVLKVGYTLMVAHEGRNASKVEAKTA